MKLKEAIEAVKSTDFNFVAVDRSGRLWAYENLPEVNTELGDYSGSKDWKDTLRNVE